MLCRSCLLDSWTQSGEVGVVLYPSVNTGAPRMSSMSFASTHRGSHASEANPAPTNNHVWRSVRFADTAALGGCNYQVSTIET